MSRYPNKMISQRKKEKNYNKTFQPLAFAAKICLTVTSKQIDRNIFPSGI